MWSDDLLVLIDSRRRLLRFSIGIVSVGDTLELKVLKAVKPLFVKDDGVLGVCVNHSTFEDQFDIIPLYGGIGIEYAGKDLK